MKLENIKFLLFFKAPGFSARGFFFVSKNDNQILRCVFYTYALIL
nr:MAG TPA: hypothetical protein [Caudoviricetes sp.]